MSVVLSSGVRQALSALQSNASAAAVQQIRLATGKKVNSAIDNPANFFTAAGLNDRAGDLSRLLDSMGQATKTIEAADKGITGIKKLVETAQGIARQALQSKDATARTALLTQYNDLRTQIDQISKDSGYNGTNLLGGNDLKVTFNEKTGTDESSLTITGVTYDSAGLAIAAGAGWTADAAGDTAIGTSLTELDTATKTLRTAAATFGANLAVVQNRQEFTQGLVDTLQTGADKLVVADNNEEGAKLLALNTRQQIASTSLSLASQQDQAVLRLFG